MTSPLTNCILYSWLRRINPAHLSAGKDRGAYNDATDYRCRACGAFSVPAIAQVRTSDPYASRFWYGALDYGYAPTGGVSLNGGNIAIGYRFSPHFGLEVGDFISQKNVLGFNTTVNSAYIDAMTLLPINRRFTAFVSAGGAYANDSIVSSVSLSGTGWRVGAGLETRITRRIDLRLGYHYQTALSDANEYTMGLAFRF